MPGARLLFPAVRAAGESLIQVGKGIHQLARLFRQHQ
jgi:hypothetical protein